MSKAQINHQPSDINCLIGAVSRHMDLTDGGKRSFRALALLLALSLQHEQIEQGVLPELKELSNDLLALIEFYDECVLFHESNIGRAKQ